MSKFTKIKTIKNEVKKALLECASSKKTPFIHFYSFIISPLHSYNEFTHNIRICYLLGDKYYRTQFDCDPNIFNASDLKEFIDSIISDNKYTNLHFISHLNLSSRNEDKIYTIINKSELTKTTITSVRNYLTDNNKPIFIYFNFEKNAGTSVSIDASFLNKENIKTFKIDTIGLYKKLRVRNKTIDKQLSKLNSEKNTVKTLLKEINVSSEDKLKIELGLMD